MVLSQGMRLAGAGALMGAGPRTGTRPRDGNTPVRGHPSRHGHVPRDVGHLSRRGTPRQLPACGPSSRHGAGGCAAHVRGETCLIGRHTSPVLVPVSRRKRSLKIVVSKLPCDKRTVWPTTLLAKAAWAGGKGGQHEGIGRPRKRLNNSRSISRRIPCSTMLQHNQQARRANEIHGLDLPVNRGL